MAEMSASGAVEITAPPPTERGRHPHATVLLGVLLLSALVATACTGEVDLATGGTRRPPSFIVVYADDLGYGDLSSYGHPTIRTPNLDRMAAEGQRWTSFYVAAPVCSPSRGALLTGRHPLRTGLYGRRNRVLFPGDRGGLPAAELTLAEALRDLGYATAMIGKWHLGDAPEHLPHRHGFDRWFGTPYSNDMMWTLDTSDRERLRDVYYHPRVEYWNLPIYREDEIVEQPAYQPTLTRRYSEEAVRFVREQGSRPFFLYLAHAMPHMPLFRAPESEGRSAAGVYGDVIEEIDWGMGEILKALEEEGLERDTLVLFTSDNGPWRLFRQHGGSAGPLRGGKGTTFEGGMRVPAVWWWPGTVSPGLIGDIGSTLDLWPTVVKLAGGELPAEVDLDGVDLGTVLRGLGPSPRREVSFYRAGRLHAFRQGPFKAHFISAGAYGEGPPRTAHDPPLLYHLGDDSGESVDVAERFPQIARRLLQRAREHRAALAAVEPIFDLGKSP